MALKKIRAVSFDWGGVISTYPAGNFTQTAAALLGISVDEFHRVYYSFNHIMNKGRERPEEATAMWSAVLNGLGKGDELDRFMAFLKSRPAAIIDQDIVRLIKHLKSAGLKIGLLSNASLDAASDIKTSGINDLFDAALFSAEIGFIKPEPQAFHLLSEKLGVPLAEMVFIDDSAKSLASAGELGYEPILYRGYDDLAATLERLGVSVAAS
jgi:putative hydrolase of the HAD superfamily